MYGQEDEVLHEVDTLRLKDDQTSEGKDSGHSLRQNADKDWQRPHWPLAGAHARLCGLHEGHAHRKGNHGEQDLA